VTEIRTGPAQLLKIWVGVTDKNWYEHLIRLAPEEANFWQPSGSRIFRVLQPGEPFLFKLHSPENFIVGGGFSFAIPHCLRPWLGRRLTGMRRYRVDDQSVDPVIGCNVLAEPSYPRRHGRV